MAMSEGPDGAGAVVAPGGALAAAHSFVARFRVASWLGWQIESNWADALTFIVYAILRPLGTALILAGMYWAVAGTIPRRGVFAAFYLANAFHEYVTRILVGMGWMIVEEREEYETLRYLYASPIGLATYLLGRTTVKFALATVSVALVLVTGWFLLGVKWNWATVQWLPLAATMLLIWTAAVAMGLLMAGWALVLPRAAISMNEGVGVGLYLLCGVIFPIDLLPWGIRHAALALPFTWGYEALRRFVLGAGASKLVTALSDAQLLAVLAGTTAALVVASRLGFAALDRRARRLGRVDQSTLF